MQKIILVLIIVGAFHLSNAQAPQSTNGKVGYANTEYIVSQLPDMKAIESEMKSTQTQLRNQIQSRSQEVQKQYSDFNANMNTMADTVRTRKQQEVEQAMADLERMQQEAQVTLQNKQKLYMAPIYLKVNKAISDVAKENGYSIILTDKIGSYDFLLYRSGHLDVSNLVLQKLGVSLPAK